MVDAQPMVFQPPRQVWCFGVFKIWKCSQIITEVH